MDYSKTIMCFNKLSKILYTLFLNAKNSLARLYRNQLFLKLHYTIPNAINQELNGCNLTAESTFFVKIK